MISKLMDVCLCQDMQHWSWPCLWSRYQQGFLSSFIYVQVLKCYLADKTLFKIPFQWYCAHQHVGQTRAGLVFLYSHDLERTILKLTFKRGLPKCWRHGELKDIREADREMACFTAHGLF